MHYEITKDKKKKSKNELKQKNNLKEKIQIN